MGVAPRTRHGYEHNPESITWSSPRLPFRGRPVASGSAPTPVISNQTSQARRSGKLRRLAGNNKSRRRRLDFIRAAEVLQEAICRSLSTISFILFFCSLHLSLSASLLFIEIQLSPPTPHHTPPPSCPTPVLRLNLNNAKPG